MSVEYFPDLVRIMCFFFIPTQRDGLGITPLLQMKKLRFTKIKRYSQGPTVGDIQYYCERIR
jgi:hypothetical protein